MEAEAGHRRGQESGLYIVLVAVMLFMLIGLIVLVVGLGAIGTNKTRLQNAANSAALAALESYINADPALTSYAQKAGAAVDRANKVLSVNRMPGTSRELGELALAPAMGEGGYIEFGMWYAKALDPASPNAHCAGVYPCFEAYDGTVVRDVTAARVIVNNQSDNPLVIGIAGMLGQSNFFLTSNATAALAPRCIAYLMDVSGSAQYETHPTFDAAFNGCNPTLASAIPGAGCGFTGSPTHPQVTPCNPVSCIPEDCDAGHCLSGGDPALYYRDFSTSSPAPLNVGYGFLREANVNGIDCTNILSFTSPESRYWCNYERATRGGAPVTSIFRHNRNDFEIERTDLGGFLPSAIDILVDKLHVPGLYEGPQPLTRNFLAFNAGLRLVQSTASPGDLSVVMAFTREIRDRYPDPIENNIELTRDLGFLVQLTNVENRGLKDWQGVTVPGVKETHPNFIDRGWFPLPSIAGGDETNIVLALLTAANALRTSCIPTARKAIILATDGVSTCSLTDSASPQPVCPSNSYPNYMAAENQLLNTDIYSGSPRIPNILQLLSDLEISLTALVDSTGVKPNFYAIRSNASGCSYPSGGGVEPTDPRCYLSFEEAGARGYGGVGNPRSFFDYSSYVPPEFGANTEENAYVNFGKPGVVFGRPVGVLGRIAIQTGGWMCGLLQVEDPSYYESLGDRGGAACDAPCDTTQYTCSPCVLKGQYRVPSCDPENGLPCGPPNAQTISPVFLSKSEQAARCVSNTVGLNPFTLVAKDTDL